MGSAPVLDVSSAKMGANVSEREVQGLPVNGRQMSQLMLQAPGSQNAGTGTWNDVRFSGRAVEQNVIKYDGIEGSGVIDSAPGVANGENNTPFKLQASLENVQEFRIESSAYPAEFGTGTGGQISVVTKSGANAFHGNVFEYARRDRFDARNYFDSLRNADGSKISEGPKSPLTLDQFGGSVGGPIAENKAFFFGSYEGYRLDAGLNFVEAVPSDAAWARAVPAVAPLRPGFLAPGAVILPGASTNPDFDIAQNQSTQHVDENAFSGRVDLRFNNNWSSYVRVFRDARHERRAAGRDRTALRHRDHAGERGVQPAGAARQRYGQRAEGRLQRRAINRVRHDQPGVRRHRAQPERDRGQLRHRGSERQFGGGEPRGPGARQQRRQRPWRALRSVLADVRGLDQPRRRQPLPEAGRRRPDDPDEHRSAGRDHVHLSEPGRVSRQHPLEHPVLRRPERAQPVPRWRLRRAPHRAGVLRRIRPGRVAREPEANPELRAPL